MGRTVRQLEHALRAAKGNLSAAAVGLGMTREGLRVRVNKSPLLQQALSDAREELVDIAENRLLDNVLAGDMTAIIWTLKASPAAKARGWGEKQEISGPNNGPVEVAIVKGYVGVSPDEWDADGDAN